MPHTAIYTEVLGDNILLCFSDGTSVLCSTAVLSTFLRPIPDIRRSADLMTFSSKVSVLIKSRGGTNFCDMCLLEKIGSGNLSMINEATRHLAKGWPILGFSRSDGRCGLCGKMRIVIHSTEQLSVFVVAPLSAKPN